MCHLFFLSSAPVLSVVINSTSEMCFSGSADSTIICWSIPSLDIDPYGPYSEFWVIYNKLLRITCRLFWVVTQCFFPVGRSVAWRLERNIRSLDIDPYGPYSKSWVIYNRLFGITCRFLWVVTQRFFPVGRNVAWHPMLKSIACWIRTKTRW